MLHRLEGNHHSAVVWLGDDGEHRGTSTMHTSHLVGGSMPTCLSLCTNSTSQHHTSIRGQFASMAAFLRLSTGLTALAILRKALFSLVRNSCT